MIPPVMAALHPDGSTIRQRPDHDEVFASFMRRNRAGARLLERRLRNAEPLAQDRSPLREGHITWLHRVKF